MMPSFVRGMFNGVIHDTLLFPYPDPLERRDPTEAHRVRTLISRLREIERDLVDSQAIDEQELVPEPVIQALADGGLLGLTIPEEFEGQGLSPAGYARVIGEVSRIDASIAVLVGVHCGLGSKAIVLYGSPAQKQRYLPMLARGKTLAAYALTEPETGSDAQHIRSRAERGADGASWILNGHKQWIGNGHRAGVIVTFVQTPVERHGGQVQRPTAFIIRPDMPGFKVMSTVRKLGIRGSTQAELVYTNLAVPDDHVLGTVGKGFAVAVHVLNGGRLSLAAGCTAGAKHILGHMTTFAEGRVQFGQPIADFEITQRKLAQLAADAYAADSMLGLLADMAGRPTSDSALEAACCKVFASELLWRASDEMVQVAGGRGFVKPYPYERMLRDARINRIFEGTNEILRLFIALNGIQGPAGKLRELAAALKHPLRNLGLVSGFAASRLRSRLGASSTFDATLHPRIEGHKRYLERHVQQLGEGTQRLLQVYKEHIVDRQQELERLANMAVDLFATAAVLARTQRLIEERGIAACAHEVDLCDLFVVDAGHRFRAARESLQSLQDETRRVVARSIRDGGGYAVDDALLDYPIPSE
ncbi:MAG TPA: acyl-CoA dehydrogenase family protein [Gemmatimonadaceae bacterium]|nr:acyl-CoA dehydrogenase family protein [Gemmatimonadaceae bacterium]